MKRCPWEGYGKDVTRPAFPTIYFSFLCHFLPKNPDRVMMEMGGNEEEERYNNKQTKEKWR